MDEETYPYPEPPAFGWYAEDYAWGKEHGLDDNGEPLRPYAKPAVRLLDESDGFAEQGSAEAEETAAAGSLVSPEAGSQADAPRPTYEDDGRGATQAGRAATANGGAAGSADARPTLSEDGGAGHVSTAGGRPPSPFSRRSWSCAILPTANPFPFPGTACWAANRTRRTIRASK